jgi:hypothetical protein
VNNALVIGNKEIEAGITGMGSKRLYQLFHYRWDGDVSNGDGVEWVEVVYDMEGTSIAFDYAEPSGVVSGIGRFIRTGRYLFTDDFDKFIVETRQDGDILVDPWRMRDGRDAHWREVGMCTGGKKSCLNSPFSSSIHDRLSSCSLTK